MHPLQLYKSEVIPKHEVDVPSDQTHQEKFEDNIGNRISITQIHDIPYSLPLEYTSARLSDLKG
jgi:hypothetical protein